MIRKLKCNVYSYMGSLVGIRKHKGIPVSYGNYFSVVLQEDKDMLEAKHERKSDQVNEIFSDGLNYKVVNMWKENFDEAIVGLNPIDVVVFIDDETKARSIFIADERIPASYKMSELFYGYGVGRSLSGMDEIEAATELKFKEEIRSSMLRRTEASV